MKIKLVASVLGITAVLGCTGETDPTKTNIFDNIANLQSGEYDRQIEEQEAIAAGIANQNASLERSNAELGRQQATNRETIAQLRSEIAEVERQLSAARLSLADQPAKLAQLDGLGVQLMSLRNSANQGASERVVRSELNSIRSAIRALGS